MKNEFPANKGFAVIHVVNTAKGIRPGCGKFTRIFSSVTPKPQYKTYYIVCGRRLYDLTFRYENRVIITVDHTVVLIIAFRSDNRAGAWAWQNLKRLKSKRGSPAESLCSKNSFYDKMGSVFYA